MVTGSQAFAARPEAGGMDGTCVSPPGVSDSSTAAYACWHRSAYMAGEEEGNGKGQGGRVQMAEAEASEEFFDAHTGEEATWTEYQSEGECSSGMVVRDLDTGKVMTLQQAEEMYPAADPFSTVLRQGATATQHVQETRRAPVDALREQEEAAAVPARLHGGALGGGRGKARARLLATLQRDGVDRTNGGAVWALSAAPAPHRLLAAAGRDTVVRLYRCDVAVGLLVLVQQWTGHTFDVIDLAWSSNAFLLSASGDHTVRLWHVDRAGCLAVFQHTEFVSSVAFHPHNDGLFLSGSMDRRIRLWDVAENKVVAYLDCGSIVTAVAWTRDGGTALVGTYAGQLLLYTCNDSMLTFAAKIEARSRRGKNSKAKKITGLAVDEETVLVTTNDSRIRRYDLKTLQMVCKYKGNVNLECQIRADWGPRARVGTGSPLPRQLIVCGSEDGQAYVWDAEEEGGRGSGVMGKLGRARKDHNANYEAWEVLGPEGGEGTVTAVLGLDTVDDMLAFVTADNKGAIQLFRTRC